MTTQNKTYTQEELQIDLKWFGSLGVEEKEAKDYIFYLLERSYKELKEKEEHNKRITNIIDTGRTEQHNKLNQGLGFSNLNTKDLEKRGVF